MDKMLGFLGGTVGSYAGWAIGDRVGLMTAFMLSFLGTGVGIWGARRLGQRLLE